MQTATHLLRTLFLLAATVSLSSNAEDLLDISGNAVQPGVNYHIVSAKYGAGGGGVLPVRYSADSSCASYVGWAPNDLNRGVPVTINSVNNPNAKSIAVGENVYIEFSKVDSCVETPFWTVADNEGLVATGGSKPVAAAPPMGRSDNMFALGKAFYNNTYELSYCPCNQCRMACSRIGRSRVNGRGILGAGSQSHFILYVIKADRTASSEPLDSDN